MVLIHTEASVEAKSVSNVALPPKKSLGIVNRELHRAGPGVLDAWEERRILQEICIVRCGLWDCSGLNVVSWGGLISSESCRNSSMTFASIASTRKPPACCYIACTGIVISRSSIDKSLSGSPHGTNYKQPTRGLSMPVDDCTSPHA